MIEMLNRSGWLVTRPELNHPNPELVRTTPNPAHNLFIGLVAVIGQFRNMDPLNGNQHGSLLC